MNKNKNRKKGPAKQQGSSYNHFLQEMQLVLKMFFPERDFKTIPDEYKRMMYHYNIRINNPKAGNEYINSNELKIISDKIKKYYRKALPEHDDKKLSTYQIELLYCYSSVRVKELEKHAAENEEEINIFKDLAQEMLTAFYSRFLIDNFKIITQLSNAGHKYYGIEIRPAAIFKDNPSMELVTEIYGIPVQKYMMEINGIKRPVFQLGKALATTPVEWITVDASLLRNFYKGEKKDLQVYIQSHALSRLKERLDMLDSEAINYTIWENTNSIQKFEYYQGYLLLPYRVFDLKIGYLAANVIEERLLFRTFLFITHNSTPEGDRLKKITGLGKEDISYWRIDRLSTFMKLNEKQHSSLIRLFHEAEIDDLMQLKDKDFNIDTIQEANLDGLAEYINKSKREPSIFA
jgi:hypothetical protein